MSNPVEIHEGFMNGSRIILPRVGVGVGVGVIGHPCLAGNWVPLSPPWRTRRMDALASLAGVIA